MGKIANDGFGAVVAAGIVGTIAWAIARTMKDENAVAETKIVYTRQPSKDGIKEALFGFLGDALIDKVGDLTGLDQPQNGGFVPPDNGFSFGYTPTVPEKQYGAPVGGLSGLLGLIRSVEAPQGFDQVYGGSKIPTPKPLTQMTVAEVQQWQRDSVAAGSKSSAAGGYQIISKTLASLVSDGTLSPNEKFDAEAQERGAISLMKRRGLDGYQNGRISPEKFANNLAKEWASLPVVTGSKTGRSYYAGDGLNKSLVRPDQVLAKVREI